MHYSLSSFKKYAQFLLDNHIEELALHFVEKAKKSNSGILHSLSEIYGIEALEISKKGFVEYTLIPVINENPFEELKKILENWRSDTRLISKNIFHLGDIIEIQNLRKQTLFDYLEYYSISPKEVITLVKEIDHFFETCTVYGLEVYEEIHNERLHEKSEMLSVIVNNFPVIITKLDHKGNTLYSAGAGLKHLGLDAKDQIGKNIFDDYPDAKNTRRALAGKTVSFTGTAKSVSGEVREYQNYFIPEKYGVLGFSIDITEQREAEERFRNLVDAVKDYAIFILDPKGNIISWNQGGQRLKGYTREEIIGKHFSIFYTEEKKKEKFPEFELERALHVGRFEDEGIRVKKDGSTFYANVIISPLYNSDGQHIGFSKITRDLTERKNNEENLKKLNLELEEKVKERTVELSNTIEELKKINNDLDNFIYTASHDLKAPISNIEGLINGLYDELNGQVQENPTLALFRELLDTSISRFQTTIKELTEIAKIQKETIENEEEIDLEKLVEDVKITISNLIEENDAKINLIPSEIKKIPFVRKNLNSILYNLISNGIKYKHPERIPVIDISLTANEKYYILTCRDNGLGIKENNIDKIFSMFKRFNDEVEGSGIGLYIVKRIVENSGGRIQVESKVGEGSIFKIFLPKKSAFLKI